MKKINNSGFTLIELLATIVILSIVVGVTVPISNQIISNSKHKALGVMVDSAEKFVADQWKINKTDPDTTTEAFKTAINGRTTGEWVNLDVSNSSDKELIEEMGISSEDVKTVDFIIDDDGISCVVITKIPVDSGIFNSVYWKKLSVGDVREVIPNEDNNDRYYSNCCLLEDVQNLMNERYG